MKPNIFLTAVIYVAALASCAHTNEVTIKSSTNGRYQKLQYSGMVSFTVSDKATVSMSPNSRVQYRENDIKLDIDCDKSGRILYALNGGDKTEQPSAEERSVLDRAALYFTKNRPKH